MSQSPSPSSGKTVPALKLTLLSCLGIAMVTFIVIWIIRSTEPTAQREGASRITPMLVEVIQPEFGTFTPVIRTLGTVEAENDLILSPRVNGQVISLADVFKEGSVVREGEILLQIDPADYETLLAQRRSELQQAEADYAIEQGRRQVAEQDLQRLGRDVPEESRSLILREPQRMAAQARVELAQASLRRAELDLGRTTLRAPFDAQVIERHATVGSQVSSGTPLGRLVAIHNYRVIVTLPLSKMERISMPSASGREGSLARLRHASAWPKEMSREGVVTGVIGALDERSRLARVIITVEDPLALLPENSGQPELIIGSMLEVEIEAQPLEQVVRLDRDYLRQNNTIWVMEDGLLRILPVTVAYQDETFAYISKGLPPDALVVTTSLRRVSEGAPLRLSAEVVP